MASKKIPEERLIELASKISLFSRRDPEKKRIIENFAEVYGVSSETVYRRLRNRRPSGGSGRSGRSDAGKPRSVSAEDMKKYCRIIAAMKLKTENKKGRHLPTSECLRLLEEHGLHTAGGLVKAPKGKLKKSTVNRYLKKWGYDLKSLKVEPPAVRFQAERSNDLWHFDVSPSDLKQLEKWPDWAGSKNKRIKLMLHSVVDDRSGAVWYEYCAGYGEDAESALKFLYNAMAPKEAENCPFQGIPKTLYMDNGPLAKSGVFKRVMEYLGIKVKTHMPQGKDGRRTTARAKGKVERPFRTVKDVHETLYHFHKPANVEEANQWLINHILRYNEGEHRSEPHSRIEDWAGNLPPDGFRKMCSWERFVAFTREPERRLMGKDSRLSLDNVVYQVSPELIGREVIVWRGLFDDGVYAEADGEKFGPYKPVAKAISLNRFRPLKKTRAEKRADRIEKLAREIKLPLAALTRAPKLSGSLNRELAGDIPAVEFNDPDPFDEIFFPSVFAAKKAVAAELGMPLARLKPEEMEFVDKVLADTMKKQEVLSAIKDHFKNSSSGEAV